MPNNLTPGEMPDTPIEVPDQGKIPEITPVFPPETTPVPDEPPTEFPIEEPTLPDSPEEVPPTP